MSKARIYLPKFCSRRHASSLVKDWRRLTQNYHRNLPLAMVLALTLGLPAPVARASETEARLEIVLQNVKVHDDNEFAGQGEMELTADLWRCPAWVPLPCLENAQGIARWRHNFNADSGDVISLDHLFPGTGDRSSDVDAPAGTGFAVYAGYHHVLRVKIMEDDGSWTSDDDMGEAMLVIDTAENGLGIGTHADRSNQGSGDFTVTYEVRRAPVPDLRPVEIKVQDKSESAKLICVAVQNPSDIDAGPFDATLRFGTQVKVLSADGVVSNYSRDLCLETEPLKAGEHVLMATVDELGKLPEFNESNNELKRTYSVAAPPPQADLLVNSIRVRGQVPDGQKDCKKGRNDVAFTIQNLGSASAAANLARLTVDDEDPVEKAIPALDAGKSIDVTLEDVRIGKRTHTLSVLADAKTVIAESNENNNTKSVTVDCEDDDD